MTSKILAGVLYVRVCVCMCVCVCVCVCVESASIIYKNPQAPSAIIGALIYRSIPSDLRSRPVQSDHLPGALLLR